MTAPALIDASSSSLRRKVVGLVRVSTAGQAADDRGGIPRQREVIRRTIDVHNLDCLRIYELVDVSGTKVRDHPDVLEIIRLVESGLVVGLVLADLDRLFRPDQPTDYAILQTFKDSGAIIYSGDTTYDLGSKDGMLFSGIRASIAAFELALIKERMQGAKEAKRKQGKCPTNKHTLPLGVSYDRANEKFFYNGQIGTVQELFRLVDEEGMRNYREMEHRSGVKSVTIPHILRNRLYLGERVIDEKRGAKRVSRTGRVYREKVKRSEDEVIRAKVIDAPAVSEERFNRVQVIIDEVRYNHHEARARDRACNLGTGVARCGFCGSRIYCSSYKSRKVKGHRPGYYYCRRNYYLFKEGDGCKHPNIRQPYFDELLETFTVQTLTSPETLTTMVEESVLRTEEVVCPFATTKPQLELLEQRERRLLDALEQGVVTITEFRERRAKIQAQRSTLEAAPKPDNSPRRLELEEFVGSVVRGAFALKRVKDPFEKKSIIQATFTEVFFRGDEITAFRFNKPLPGTTGKSTPVVHLTTPFRIRPVENPVPEGHKRCSSCSAVLTVDRFYRRVNRCKPCMAAEARRAYHKRKERRIAAVVTPEE